MIVDRAFYKKLLNGIIEDLKFLQGECEPDSQMYEMVTQTLAHTTVAALHVGQYIDSLEYTIDSDKH